VKNIIDRGKNMIINIYYLAIILSAIFIVYVIELVRRDRLEEKHSLLWIGFSIMLILLSCNIELLKSIAAYLDVKYAPAVIFLFGILFLIFYALYLTMRTSNITKKLIKLSQEVAIMKLEKELEKKNEESS
jgi:hypothetical protein